VSCNNATVSNRQLTGGILTLWLISPLGVTKEHPRFLLEIPRGTKRYKKIKSLRPASERINSSVKDKDNGVLSHPEIRGDKRASILTQIAAIVILLKRILGFILRVSFKNQKTIRRIRQKTSQKAFSSFSYSCPPSGNCPERIKIHITQTGSIFTYQERKRNLTP